MWTAVLCSSRLRSENLLLSSYKVQSEMISSSSCALFLFFRFTLVQKHTVEFNQVAMANSEGSEVMLNRVMTKDNIGVAVLLEVKKDLFASGKDLE